MLPRFFRTYVSLTLLLLTSMAFARFEWRDVVQTVEIQADGTVVVNDERTLWTDEDFGEAFICLQLNRNQSVRLLADSGAISPGPSATAFMQPCDGGTELVVRNSQRLQERRVRFHYELTGAVDAYADVVQWYWIILEQDHPLVKNYQLRVITPGSMQAPYDAYVHTFSNPDKPVVNLSADRSELTVTYDRIPSGDGLEIRYLMPPENFTITGSGERFEALLRDEARIAGIQQTQQRLRALRQHPFWALVPLGILLSLIAGVFNAYRRFGREPQLPSMKYPFEPPDDIPPAAVAALESQTGSGNSSNAFSATIMDLARRGYGEFTGSNKKFSMMLNLSKDTSSLESFEKDVLNYLKQAAAQPKASGFLGLQTAQQTDEDRALLEFRELKKYSEKHLSSFMSSWSKKPRKWIEARYGGPLVSEESRRGTTRWTITALLAVLACGLGIFVTLGLPRAAFVIAATLCFVMIFVIQFSLPSWRKDIAADIYGWQGFKRTLSDYTRMKDAPDDFFHLWDKYYCYAAAYGVAQKFLKNIQRAAPLRGLDERQLTRQASWMGAHNSSSLSGLSKSISSLSSALTAASASASSGGSSSGGGGGGGGGSSGGR